jgi:DNA-binding HxlR family transcriptional regulator
MRPRSIGDRNDIHSTSSRQAYPVVPPRVDYSLTDRGRELAGLLLPLVDWVTANAANGSA